jgi:hypothetical protein
MYQIDVSTAVASMPTPAAYGTPGFFTNGNPGTGQPATIVPADFLNAVMVELINVVTAGGLALDKGSFTQLRDAIINMIADGVGGGGTSTVTNVTGIAPINSTGGATPQISISAATEAAAGSMSAADKTKLDGIAAGATANTGTVTSISVVSANGISATIANPSTTPAITLVLGAITPTSVSASGAVNGASGTFSGAMNVGSLNSGADVKAGQNFTSATGAVVLAPNGAGTVYLRPNGAASATGQATISNAGNMSVGGSVTASGGFQMGSSLKIKTRLRKLGYGLADLLKIQTRRGRYKKSYSKDGRDHLFVIAEQLREVIPEVVYEQKGATPTVNYMELVPVLIAAVQELAARVVKLEDQING